MSVGLSQKFNILQQSPHDFEPVEQTQPVQGHQVRWMPSRYNIRAKTGDGRLILWNTYRGTMSVFTSAQSMRIETLLSRKGFEGEAKGIVEYLYDRGFLIREGTDEYRRIQLGFGQQHYRTDTLQLILLASEDCNLRCQYCYEEFSRGTMQPNVRAGIKKLLLKRIGSLQYLSVGWFGGEPLYGFQAIEDLAPFFLEMAAEHSLQFSSHMTTNGYLLTPEAADKLLAWNIRAYQITLDGPPEDHDRSRPTRNGQGSFSTIFENLKALKLRADEYVVDIRINFDRRNHPKLDAFLGTLEKEFRNDSRFRLRFRAVGQWGGPNDDELEVCSFDEAARIQMEMRAEARKRGLNIGDDIRQVEGMGAQVCYAARPYNFIVGSSGKLMKCTIDLDMQDRNVVGQLTDEGEMKLDRDKLAAWTEPAFERDSKCQKCVVLPVCQGVYCPLIRIETGKSPCTPLRQNAKEEIVATVESYQGMSRKVIVNDGVTQRTAGPLATL